LHALAVEPSLKCWNCSLCTDCSNVYPVCIRHRKGHYHSNI